MFNIIATAIEKTFTLPISLTLFLLLSMFNIIVILVRFYEALKFINPLFYRIFYVYHSDNTQMLYITKFDG